MLQKIVDMPIGEARYIVLKSLDTHDTTGRLILHAQPNALQIVAEMVQNIIVATTPGDGGINAFEFQNVDNLRTFVSITRDLPSYMLLDVNCPQWESFLNAWLVIGDRYQELLDKAIENCGENTSPKLPIYQEISVDLRVVLNCVVRLIEIGNGYIDLLQATTKLLNEIKTWGDARPTSIKMSEAYLNALDFYKQN